MAGEAARVRESALVAQDIDEDAVASLVMEAIDRCPENTVVIHGANPTPLALDCSLGKYPRFAKYRTGYQYITAKADH